MEIGDFTHERSRLAGAALAVSAAFLLSGCFNADLAWTEEAGTAPVGLAFANTPGQVVPVTALSNFQVGGTCPTGTGFTLSLSGATTGTVPCSNGTWGLLVDLSGVPDGPLSLTAALSPAPTTGPATATLSLVKDTQAPNPVTIPAIAGPVFGSSPALSWKATTDVGLAGLSPTQPYYAQVFSGSTPCSGTSILVQFGWSSTLDFVPTGLANGGMYSYSVFAQDAAGNQSAPTCSGLLTINSTPAGFSLSDPNANAGYARSQAGALIAILPGSDTGAAGWCVSEKQTTPPLSGAAPCVGGQGVSGGWYTGTPNGAAFTLSSGDGPKAVYLWITDGQGNIKGASSNPVTITLAATPPGAFAITGQTNGADGESNAYLVDLTGGGGTFTWNTPTVGVSGMSEFFISITDKTAGTSYCSSAPASGAATSLLVTGCSGYTVGHIYGAVATAVDHAGNSTVSSPWTFTAGNPVAMSFSGSTTQTTTYPAPLSFSFQWSNPNPYVPTTVLGGAVGNADFATSGCSVGTVIPPGSSCTINVVFTPSQGGSETSTFEIAYDSGEALIDLSQNVTVTINPNTAVSVQPVYGTHGAYWTDYVQYGSINKPVYNQADQACPGGQCIHGGEILNVQAPGGATNWPTSCTGFTGSDTLGAFKWVCDASILGKVTFYSTGLVPGVPFSTLLKGNGLAYAGDSFVGQLNGVTVVQTPSVAWWPNTLALASTSATSTTPLSTPHTIYTIPTGTSLTKGVYIGAAHVSLIIYPGAKLGQPAGVSENCNSATGNTTSPNNFALICSSFSNLWIEGSLECEDINAIQWIDGVVAVGSNYSVFRNLLVSDPNDRGIWLQNSSGAQVLQSAVSDSQIGPGVEVDSSSGVSVSFLTVTGALGGDNIDLNVVSNSSFSDVATDTGGSIGLSDVSGTGNNFYRVSVNDANYGIAVQEGSREIFQGITTANNGSAGITLFNSTGTSLVNVISTGNLIGIQLTAGSTKNTIHQATVTHNGLTQTTADTGSTTGYNAWDNLGGGLYIDSTSCLNSSQPCATTDTGDSHNMIVDSIFEDNYRGVYLGASASTNTFYNVVSSENAYGFELQAASNNTFAGYLGAANNSVAQCSITGGATPGIGASSGACTGTGGLNILASASLETSFVGRVDPDTKNPVGGTNGQASYGSIVDGFMTGGADDWTAFEFLTSAWGRTGSSNYDSSSREQCAGGTCQIWSFALLNSDGVLLNQSFTGQGVNTPAFSAGGACPAAISGGGGTISLTSPFAVQAFIVNAVESPDEPQAVGNHDGLCNAGETCVYAPNIGAYLGHGTITDDCTMAPATLWSAGSMYAFPNNGYP